ncbi:MAG: hypothetical protein ACRDRW_08765 [Pseudonocardiaceae bacterium]
MITVGSTHRDMPHRYGDLSGIPYVELRIDQDGVVVSLDEKNAVSFQPGTVHNLLADRSIHSHSDVTGPQVGFALRSAIATGMAVS